MQDFHICNYTESLKALIYRSNSYILTVALKKSILNDFFGETRGFCPYKLCFSSDSTRVRTVSRLWQQEQQGSEVSFLCVPMGSSRDVGTDPSSCFRM